MEYPTFVSTLFKMTESSDDSAKVVAFETIGYVGISLEGKRNKGAFFRVYLYQIMFRQSKFGGTGK